MNRVFLTGGTGFIGSAVAYRFVNTGGAVSQLVRLTVEVSRTCAPRLHGIATEEHRCIPRESRHELRDRRF